MLRMILLKPLLKCLPLKKKGKKRPKQDFISKISNIRIPLLLRPVRKLDQAAFADNMKYRVVCSGQLLAGPASFLVGSALSGGDAQT